MTHAFCLITAGPGRRKTELAVIGGPIAGTGNLSVGTERAVTETVAFVTEVNPQSRLLMQYLAERGDQQFEMVDAGEWLDVDPQHSYLLLLDVDHVSTSQLNWYQEKSDACDASIILAAFNVRDMEHSTKLIGLADLRGFFYRDDRLEMICRGIRCLFDGELWMSRKLMASLIRFYRDSPSPSMISGSKAPAGLTRRELEITTHLAMGASNQQIADKLFLSEHTVKTHIYNIYRKINVKNRVQALNWIRETFQPKLSEDDEEESGGTSKSSRSAARP